MSVSLLDVNVLVAFLWPPHSHHQLVVPWFKRARNDGWATCPITELGCLRVLGGPAVGQGRVSILSAAEMLHEFTRDALHQFWRDDLKLTDTRFAGSLQHIQGPGQLTDRYLLALAAAHDGVLTTLDRAVAAELPADSPLLQHLEVIEA